MEHVNEKKGEDFKMIGDWKDQANQLKTKFSTLTDEDLKFEVGKESHLLKKIETRLGKNRQEVIKLIKGVQPVKV